MDKDPPEHLLNSPVREVSERHARTAEALEALSQFSQLRPSDSISWLRHLSRLVQIWQLHVAIKCGKCSTSQHSFCCYR